MPSALTGVCQNIDVKLVYTYANVIFMNEL